VTGTGEKKIIESLVSEYRLLNIDNTRLLLSESQPKTWSLMSDSLGCVHFEKNEFIEFTEFIGGAENASTGKRKYGKGKYETAHFARMENACTENPSTMQPA